MPQHLQEPAVSLHAASSAPAYVPAPVERLGQWELVELVAQGSFANIYRARPSSGAGPARTAYAVKRLKLELENDSRAVAHLRREARVGRALNCPHLAPVLAARTERAPFYVVMPWIEGESLAARLSGDDRGRGASGPAAAALWIARQVAEALDALDRAGWIHSDVKPANIMLSSNGHATLLDLGLARRPTDENSELAGCLIGTPRYMAPEALLSTVRPDIRSDIYSLGAVLYELLAGRPPYVGDDAAELITAHRQQEPVPLRTLVPHLSNDVARLVHAMLAKEPLRRPQTPNEVVRRLTALEIAQLEMTNVE